jgi:septal ring factor EnvC (AmiA/AmiB activator)
MVSGDKHLKTLIAIRDARYHVRTAFMNDPSGEPTSSTPTALTETLKSLRQTNASLSEECGSLRGALDHRSAQLEDTERRLSSSASRIGGLDKALTKEKERNSYLTRRVRLLEQELASCHTLLATFDAADAALREDAAMDSADHQKWTQHINELERVLKEYKATNDALQERVNELTCASSGDPSAQPGDASGLGDVDMVVREERYARNQLESGQLSQLILM